MHKTQTFTDLIRLGFTKPNPIQKKAIPEIESGKDVLAIAPTGSGKTLAFVLPLLKRLANHPAPKSRSPEVVILSPTRELALQINGVISEVTQQLKMDVKHLAVVGGTSINPQMKNLYGVRMLVATPGRLVELLEKNALNLMKAQTFVLDEADKLLNKEFEKEVDQILSAIPQGCQHLLFSATLSEAVAEWESEFLVDPVTVKILSSPQQEKQLNQTGYFVEDEQKGPLLRYLIREREMKQVLVFTSSVAKADKVVHKLRKNHIAADAIHRKKSQGARSDILAAFKSGNLRVLVTTDLLARGIDIHFLPFVINYELPRSPKDFIHRIGRTARAENPGEAIVFVASHELPHFKVIQKKMGRRIDMIDVKNIPI